jgi:hypothetical protein
MYLIYLHSVYIYLLPFDVSLFSIFDYLFILLIAQFIINFPHKLLQQSKLIN